MVTPLDKVCGRLTVDKLVKRKRFRRFVLNPKISSISFNISGIFTPAVPGRLWLVDSSFNNVKQMLVEHVFAFSKMAVPWRCK